MPTTKKPAQPTVKQLREQVERRELEVRSKLLETASLSLWDTFVDPREQFYDQDDFWLPLSGGLAGLPTHLDNQGRGEVLPVYLNWASLKLIRDKSRQQLAYNEFAINAVENRINYIVGKGFQYKVVRRRGKSTKGDRLVEGAQRVLDEFYTAESWGEREQESVRRCDRDGEAFIRLFYQGNGRTGVRFIEPEHVKSQAEVTGDEFGIRTDEDDIESVQGYFVVPARQQLAGVPEEVDADEVVHIKLNVDSTAKRGLPTFLPVRKNLDRAEKLLRNMSVLAQVQATFAAIRKHKGHSQTAVEAFRNSQADLQVNRPLTATTGYLKNYLPGTILDTSDATEYEFPAAAVAAGGMVEILQAELRAIASRLCMPEYMLTADASNANYSSTMVAEAPATRNFERLQAYYGRRFGDGCFVDLRRSGVMWRVLWHAVQHGYLPEETLTELEIQVEGPSLIARDKGQETTRHSTLSEKGILSPQTWAKLEGLDYEQEQQNKQEIEAADPRADVAKGDGEGGGLRATVGGSQTPEPDGPPVLEAEGGTCKPGERSDLTGCTPASGEGKKPRQQHISKDSVALGGPGAGVYLTGSKQADVMHAKLAAQLRGVRSGRVTDLDAAKAMGDESYAKVTGDFRNAVRNRVAAFMKDTLTALGGAASRIDWGEVKQAAKDGIERFGEQAKVVQDQFAFTVDRAKEKGAQGIDWKDQLDNLADEASLLRQEAASTADAITAAMQSAFKKAGLVESLVAEPHGYFASLLESIGKGTCKPGERSDLTGCTPASGEGGSAVAKQGTSSVASGDQMAQLDAQRADFIAQYRALLARGGSDAEVAELSRSHPGSFYNQRDADAAREKAKASRDGQRLLVSGGVKLPAKQTAEYQSAGRAAREYLSLAADEWPMIPLPKWPEPVEGVVSRASVQEWLAGLDKAERAALAAQKETFDRVKSARPKKRGHFPADQNALRTLRLAIKSARSAGLQALGLFPRESAESVPYHQQTTDYNCGPAALQSLLAGMGVEVAQEDLAAAAGTTEQGTPPAGLVKAVEAQGLTANAREGWTLDELAAAVPVLVDIQAQGSPEQYERDESGHYVVVMAVEDGEVVYMDPSEGEDRLSATEFEQRWHDKEASGQRTVRWGMTVQAPAREPVAESVKPKRRRRKAG